MYRLFEETKIFDRFLFFKILVSGLNLCLILIFHTYKIINFKLTNIKKNEIYFIFIKLIIEKV
jgi:hypothetical protein